MLGFQAPHYRASSLPLAAHAQDEAPHSSSLGCPPSVFVVTEVLNASGGRTGCFLYRGRLVSAPAPRASTPDCCPQLPSAAGAADQCVPQLGGCEADFSEQQQEEEEAGEGQLDLAALHGQQLTLYMSYEEASPKMKQRLSGGCGRLPAAAPWRVILRDQQDDMLFCMRGMPLQLDLDGELGLMRWGPSLAVAFPSAEDARAFAAGMWRVQVAARSLAGSPQAALLAAHTAEQALRAAIAAAATAAAPCPCPCPCPASPAHAELPPHAGSKRRAEAPAALMTPLARPRLMSTASLITPTSSAELGV